MNRTHIALAAALMSFIALPQSSLAKTPTEKLTISGGALTSEIEITDPRILDISNVWTGKFLDNAEGVVKEPPPGLETYEVWFYTNPGDGRARRRYVLYYAPSPTGQGYIYLPGKGQPWYWLNVSAILRDGKDGRWNFAYPAWENLIKAAVRGRAGAATEH